MIEDATMAELKRGDAYYGWVEMCATGDTNVDVIASAVDLAGGAMIAGGGAAPTPEPSGGMLVVLGFAALTLRRRRTNAACCGMA